MQLIEHAILDGMNTMRLPCTVRYLAVVTDEAELQTLLASDLAQSTQRLILGGGSNLLLAPQLDLLAIRPDLRGIWLYEDHGDRVVVEAMAGEPWHDFVLHTLAAGWYGLENLSLIPGTVGACPIQNVGAYGVEVSDRLHSLDAVNVHTAKIKTFLPDECAFGYRDSVFKQQPDQWVITRVRFILSRTPELILGYGDVAALAGPAPTPVSVSQAICQIRASKLPDPKVMPNTGSFFKNPVISHSQYQQLKQRYPTLGGHVQSDGQIKIAAGWLIDQAGWKGRRLGPVGMHALQALVLVNPDGGQLSDVLALAQAVQHDVQQRFDIVLEREPVCVGWSTVNHIGRVHDQT